MAAKIGKPPGAGGWSKKRLVARLRQLAKEHRGNPAVAAEFNRLADNIAKPKPKRD